MSASATFELKSDRSIQELRQRVGAMWDRALGEPYRSDLFVQPDGALSVTLSWFFGGPREQEQTREIVRYLLSSSQESRLHYIRDEAFVRGSDPDYPSPITVNDLFRPEFCPGPYSGIQYRYLIQPANEKATTNI